VSYRHLTGVVLPVEHPELLDRVPTAHAPWCFGCGPDNPDGLGVRPHFVSDRVEAELELAPRFQGGPGVAHGGATAAFLDDLLGFVMMAHQRPAVTARLQVHYLQPVPVGTLLRGEAWLARLEGRKMWAEAAAMRADGAVLAEAEGLFLQVDAEHFTRAMTGEYAGAMTDWFFERERYYP
jgi:acyl-coenzyme A thioesterase PaaI-like protein